jgi:dTDP-glucose 4,6-dehydratase
MKKILVSGGAGFIGSEFVRQGVARGYTIVVVDKLSYAGDLVRVREIAEEITFHKVDIADKEGIEEIFRREKPDAIVHWAAESHVDRSIDDASPFLETNVKGTQVMLDAAKDAGVERFVNISTDEVYGDLKEEGEFLETTPLNPSSPYSVSKASADMLGRAYHRTYGLPVITVRPSNNYGPWQYPEKLLPVVVLKAFRNEKIPVYGEGINIREWLYVADCADAVFTLLEKAEPGDIYNVGSGEEKRNIEVVKTILKLINKPDNLIEFVQDRPGHDFRYSLNSEKIHEKIGWEHKVSFMQGIEKTVQWYLDHITWAEGKLTTKH